MISFDSEDRKQGWLGGGIAKNGTLVACPIQPDLAKSIANLDGETPFWTGKSDVEDATKNWQKIYVRVFESAAVDGTPHQFRHTFAKRLLVNGVPLGHVAALLGNTEEVCRTSYAKWISERQKALNEAVRGTWETAKPRHAYGTLDGKHRWNPHRHWGKDGVGDGI